jgi:hypothetical protein
MVFIVNKQDKLDNKIALISVVRNAEDTYEMCLRQASRICEEIYIVNQSSTDSTIHKIIKSNYYGKFNITNDGVLSRYDSVIIMREILKSKSLITGVRNETFGLQYKIPKRTNAISQFIPQRTFTEAYKDYIRRFL